MTGVAAPDLGIKADPSASIGPRRSSRPSSQDRAFAIVRAWLDRHVHERDVVHAHAFDAPAFDELRGLGALHTLHLPPLDEGVADAVRAADAMLATVSSSCRADWQAAGVSIDVVLSNGVAVDAIPEGRGDGGYLAFCGRMSPEKGADVACRIARAVGMPLRLAGPIYDEDYFASAVSPLLGDDVVYVGAIDRLSVWKLLGGARAALFPVRWNEAFGMVALESLACGTPVAGYRRGGLTEIVNDGRTGFLTRPDDEDALVDAVRASLDLSRSGCRESARRYDLAAMLDAHEAVYRRLIS